MKFCNRCMEQLGDEVICPHCGTDLRKLQGIPHALQPGTVLNGKYLIGNVLGQGGFGITYIGFDLALEVKVAVKEYYVTGSASRVSAKNPEVYWITDPGNMNHFITEARRMAMLGQMPEIAKVRDVFYANKTAYIIMEYVEGEELKRYLQKNGTMPYAQTVKLMLPVIEALGKIHEKDLVHRDISPDNLMMQPDGSLRVLDLGAAGDLRQNNGQASQLVARHGFSPYEQYIETGKIGPWTDVYAVCATIYYCCAGKVIPDAYARVDRYLKTKEAGIEMDSAIPPAGIEVLQKGLALDAANRIPNMKVLAEQLRESLAGGNTISSGKQRGSGGKRKSGAVKWILLGVAALAVTIGIVLFAGSGMREEPIATVIPTGSATNAVSTDGTGTSTEELLLPETIQLTDVNIGHREAMSILSGPAPGEIIWTSSNPQVVKIAETGEITALGYGSVEITGAYAGQTAVCTVTVTLKENVTCTYEKNAKGLTITGFEGNLPANAVLPRQIDGVFVTKIGNNAFRDCKGLAKIAIPDTVTQIGEYAFSDCTGLSAVSLPEKLQEIQGDAFYGCSGLVDLVIPDSVTRMGENAFSYCTGLTHVTIPEGITNLEGWVFCGCKKLAEITIPENVVKIKEGAFRYCTGLTEVIIPKQVTEIGNSAFRDCTSLTEITLSDSLSTIGEAAFSGCISLSEITIPQSAKIIKNHAFSGCTGLRNVTFPNRKINIEFQAFDECNGLTSVTISNDSELGYNAFPQNCTIHFFDRRSDYTEPAEESTSRNGETAKGAGVPENANYPVIIDSSDEVMRVEGEYLSVLVENGRDVTVTISGLVIQDSYITNLSTSKENHLEYSWELRMQGSEVYSVATTAWAFKPGMEEEKTLNELQSSLWILDQENGGMSMAHISDAALTYTDSSITWKFSIPEEYSFDFLEMKSFVVSVYENGEYHLTHNYSVTKINR